MDSKHNPKSFWSYVKSKTKKPGDVSCLEDSNGILVHDNEKKAHLFNEYFSSVFVSEADDNFFESNYIPHCDTKIETTYFTMDTVLDALDQ